MLLPFKTAAIWSSGPAASTFKDIPVSIVVPIATLLDAIPVPVTFKFPPTVTSFGNNKFPVDILL